MTTKKQLRSENIKEKKIKKSTKIFYLSMILGGGFILLAIFFVILFSAIFPPVGMDAVKKEKQIAKIYFSDQQERFFKSEKRFVNKESDNALQAKEIVKALLDGSKNELVNTFPQGVAVRDVNITDDGTALVSFSKDLLKSYQGSSSSEIATIYSLTNSITQNIPSIKKVKILVEGKELSSIKGHISTRKAFSPDLELIIPEK
jgi:hypothetical protein